MTIQDLREQAETIMRRAKASGMDSDIYFATTFDRYITQLEVLERLKDSVYHDDLIVTKNYNGKENAYINPAVREYNNTVAGANKTVSILLKIMERNGDNGDSLTDPLLLAIGGDND